MNLISWMLLLFVLLHLVFHRAHLDSFLFQLVCLATFLNVSDSDTFDPYQVFRYLSSNMFPLS